MFCVIFVNVLVWRWFGVPLIPIYAPLFSIRVPLVPICVTLSTSSPPTNIFCLYPPHPISRYFCKESLITPQHTSPLQASLLLLLPLQKFSSYYFLHFPFVLIRFPFVFHSCSLVFIRVHSCSFVFTRVHSCSTRVHSCSTSVHSCSLVFIRIHSCSFVFRSVWCFRYDPGQLVSSRKNLAQLLKLSIILLVNCYPAISRQL